MSIAVVSVPVADQDAAKRFYTEVMAFELMNDMELGPDMRWVQLQPPTGGATIALVTWFDAMKPGGLQGLVLHVPDIHAEHARLSGLGLRLPPVDAQPWGAFTSFSDPDGNGWIVAQLARPDDIRTR